MASSKYQSRSKLTASKGEIRRKTDVADVDLVSDKVGSRALVDLVRYDFSGGCEIYFVPLVIFHT